MDQPGIIPAFTGLPDLPGGDDPEVAQYMTYVGALTDGERTEVIRSLVRCALAQRRTGQPVYMSALGRDALVTIPFHGDPDIRAALMRARDTGPAGPEFSLDVRESLTARGLL